MAKDRSAAMIRRLARWRFWVQAGFLLAWLDPLMLRLQTVCGPVFHCHSCPLATFACPIGALANFSGYHLFPFAPLGMLIVLGALLGSFICGWVCPFGFLQDLIARIPTRKFVLPAWMGCFRYAVLVVLVLGVPFLFGEDHPLFFCRLCPAGALEGALPNMARMAAVGQPVFWPTPAKLTILVVIMLAMLFVWRPWCRLFCPLGAIYSLFNRFSLLFVRFYRDQCIECDKCKALCLDGGQAEQRVGSANCVRCLECSRCRAVTVGTIFSGTQRPVSDAPDAAQ